MLHFHQSAHFQMAIRIEMVQTEENSQKRSSKSLAGNLGDAKSKPTMKIVLKLTTRLINLFMALTTFTFCFDVIKKLVLDCRCHRVMDHFLITAIRSE